MHRFQANNLMYIFYLDSPKLLNLQLHVYQQLSQDMYFCGHDEILDLPSTPHKHILAL